MKTSRFIFAFVAACMSIVSIASDNPTITVKNARDFIKAIGPNRTIVIATTKPLNITEALDEMVAKGEVPRGFIYYEHGQELTPGVTYNSNTDGHGMQVNLCENLTIRGKDKKKGATLLATPRYVNVIEFGQCDNLTIENLTVGHTEEGYCEKGVLEFFKCDDVTVNDCDLFGCGTEGFIINTCNRFTANRTTIRDCSYYTMHVIESRVVRFNDCTFRDNREFEQINVSGSDDVTFTGCAFDNLKGRLFNLSDYCHFYSCTFRNCQMPDLSGLSEFFSSGNAIMVLCNFVNGVQHAVPGGAKPNIPDGRWTDGKNTFYSCQVDPYRYVFHCEETGQHFAINCISATLNRYWTDNDFPYDSSEGLVGATITTQDGRPMLNILDDGQELFKSYFYLGK